MPQNTTLLLFIRSIYYIDKIESLHFLTDVCRNSGSKHDMPYTTRFSVLRRRFSTLQNADLVMTVLMQHAVMFNADCKEFDDVQHFGRIFTTLLKITTLLLFFSSMFINFKCGLIACYATLCCCSLADKFLSWKKFYF